MPLTGIAGSNPAASAKSANLVDATGQMAHFVPIGTYKSIKCLILFNKKDPGSFWPPDLLHDQGAASFCSILLT
jgi:hypothetical protein